MGIIFLSINLFSFILDPIVEGGSIRIFFFFHLKREHTVGRALPCNMTLELDSPKDGPKVLSEPSVLSVGAGAVARFLPALVALKMVWSSGPRTEPAGSRQTQRVWRRQTHRLGALTLLLSGFVTEGAISLYEGGLGVA